VVPTGGGAAQAAEQQDAAADDERLQHRAPHRPSSASCVFLAGAHRWGSFHGGRARAWPTRRHGAGIDWGVGRKLAVFGGVKSDQMAMVFMWTTRKLSFFQVYFHLKN